MKLLLDASPPTVGSFIKLAHNAGYKVVVTDCNKNGVASKLADKFYHVYPATKKEELFLQYKQIIKDENIDIVIPILQETLVDWSKFEGCNVLSSPVETVEIFENKWATYNWFIKNSILTPETSLDKTNRLIIVKPILGRGGTYITGNPGFIWQKCIYGQEYTTDVLCDLNSEPIYTVVRERTKIESGISFDGTIVDKPKITEYVNRIIKSINFIGPINIQCIEDQDGNPWFTEINTRLGGGTVLSIAATENWFSLFMPILQKETIIPKGIRKLKMTRFYNEIFL